MAEEPTVKTLKGHADAVYALAFAADGSCLVTGSFDTTIRLWDPKTGQQQKVLSGHSTGIAALALSADGAQLASAGKPRDNTILVWDLKAGKSRKFSGGHKDAVLSLNFSKDGKQLVSTSQSDESIVIWDVAAGKVASQFEQRKPDPWANRSATFYRVAFSASGEQIFTCGTDRIVTAWDVAKGKEVHQFVTTEYVTYLNENKDLELKRKPASASSLDTLYALALSHDGQQVAAGGLHGVIHVWDLASRKVVQTVPRHPGYVVDLAFNAAGKHLLSCGHTGNLVIWNLADGKPVFQAKLPAFCHCASYSPDGAAVAAGGADGQVFLLEVPDAAR
jgi:WD40 repeat protein